eukprot:scaffold207_cov409-Prasinococcus_capsulatus_cf.AAC.126
MACAHDSIDTIAAIKQPIRTMTYLIHDVATGKYGVRSDEGAQRLSQLIGRVGYEHALVKTMPVTS